MLGLKGIQCRSSKHKLTCHTDLGTWCHAGVLGCYRGKATLDRIAPKQSQRRPPPIRVSIPCCSDNIVSLSPVVPHKEQRSSGRSESGEKAKKDYNKNSPSFCCGRLPPKPKLIVACLFQKSYDVLSRQESGFALPLGSCWIDLD